VPGKYQLVELLDLHKLGHKFFAFQLGIGMEFDLYYLATAMPRYMEEA
jgi:hypothetical protein